LSAQLSRLERERAHDREIAARAEQIWNGDSPAGRRRADRRAGLYVERAALRPGRLALELGCGTGLFLERVARSGATLVGIDVSVDLLGRARSRTAPLANVRILEGDAHRLPFPDATFDAVYGSSILHHLDLVAALREAKRVLKVGGRVAFTEPNLLNPQVAYMYYVGPRARFGLSVDEMAFTKTRVTRVLRELGYVEAAVEFFDFLHPSTPPPILGAVARIGAVLEGLPVVRALAGSMLVCAARG